MVKVVTAVRIIGRVKGVGARKLELGRQLEAHLVELCQLGAELLDHALHRRVGPIGLELVVAAAVPLRVHLGALVIDRRVGIVAAGGHDATELVNRAVGVDHVEVVALEIGRGLAATRTVFVVARAHRGAGHRTLRAGLVPEARHRGDAQGA